MKLLKFNAKIKTKTKNIFILHQNYENHEIPRIPRQNQENHES